MLTVLTLKLVSKSETCVTYDYFPENKESSGRITIGINDFKILYEKNQIKWKSIFVKRRWRAKVFGEQTCVYLNPGREALMLILNSKSQ